MSEKENKDLEFDPSASEDFMNQLSKVLEEEVQAPDLRNEIMEEDNTNMITIGLPVQPDPLDEIQEIKRIPIEREMPVKEFSPDNDAVLDEIGSCITRQVDQEVEPVLAAEPLINEDNTKLLRWYQRIPKWALISMSVFMGLLIVFVILLNTPFGKKFILHRAADYASGQMQYQPAVSVIPETVIDDVDESMTNAAQTQPATDLVLPDKDGPRKEQYVINLLLLGEEAEDMGGSRGRTDMALLLSLNTREKAIKMTTLMRDTLVSIPGHEDNKLNAAYQIGGIALLYEVLEVNFAIHIDGYALVGFDDFETIIDSLGGVSIELSEAEKNYLNNTAYVTEIKNRDLVTGLNVMNGDQALGYCRVRHVGTAENEFNDFGRTSRQKKVLMSLIDQYKSLKSVDFLLQVNRCLPYVKTDLQSADIVKVVEAAFEIGFEKEIETFRIPVEKGFTDGYVRRMSVLIPDLEKNREELQKFIFGDYKKVQEDIVPEMPEHIN